jgi:hypothetical protein
MAAAWVQKNAIWDGFLISQFGQINSLKRNTLETAFFLFKLPLKFFDQRRKSKRRIPGKNRGEPSSGPLGLIGPGRPAHPVLGGGPVPFPVYRPFFAFSAHEKKLAQKIFVRNSREIKEKLFTKIHTLFYVLG